MIRLTLRLSKNVSKLLEIERQKKPFLSRTAMINEAIILAYGKREGNNE